jgi:hypothetical protein
MKHRRDRELEDWIDTTLGFYVKGMINDDDYRRLRSELIQIAQAERRRVMTRRKLPRDVNASR